VLLSWTALPGATSYNVKRATMSGGPYTTVYSPTSNSVIDTGRTNNTKYYYVVSAVSAAGESANSSQVSATPQMISLIKDDQDLSGVTFTGTWTSSTSTPGAQGGRYSTDGNTGAAGGKKISYSPTITVAGNYKVYARWTAGANRANSVHFDVIYSGGTDYTLQNEMLNNNTWMLLGTYYLNAGTTSKVEIRNDGATNNVIADAVKFDLY
jgi:endoglucanase